MCGRFTLTKTHNFESIPRDKREVSFNIAPSNEIIILDPEPSLKTWSYSPLWAKKPFHLINCRSETMHQKPSFKGAMRCLIPTTGWYEWQDNGSQKQPYYHHINHDLFYFAGLANSQGCLIVTKEANKDMKQIHHRQPVLLTQTEGDHWLNNEDQLDSELDDLVEYYPVSTKVNSPKNNSPELIQPL